MPVPAAGELPEMGVEVRVTSEIFGDILGGAKEAGEAAVARWTAAEAQDYFSYLRWSAAAGAANGLVIVLEDREDAGCEIETVLVFRGRLDGREVALNRTPTVPFDDLCVHEVGDWTPTRFRNELIAAIDRQLADEPLRRTLSRQLLREISLAEKLHLAEQSVGLPFSHSEIRSTERSRLLVKIPSRHNPNIQVAEMTVRTALEWGPHIRCLIEEFVSPLGSLPTPVTSDPAIEEILHPDRFDRVGVYMLNYDQVTDSPEDDGLFGGGGDE